MVKNYSNKSLLLGLLLVFLPKPVLADQATAIYSLKSLMPVLRSSRRIQEKAKQLVGEIKTGFDRVANHDSGGTEVSKELDLSGQVTGG